MLYAGLTQFKLIQSDYSIMAISSYFDFFIYNYLNVNVIKWFFDFANVQLYDN
jgi:hypothetical protein